MEIIYFELNNWSCGEDCPDAEPFLSWMDYNPLPKFKDNGWVKENKLVVVESHVDMSLNYCIAATKEWVQTNCPELMTTYKNFIRHPEEDDELPYGRFGCPFMEYTEENIGVHYAKEIEDGNGFLVYSIEE